MTYSLEPCGPGDLEGIRSLAESRRRDFRLARPELPDPPPPPSGPEDIDGGYKAVDAGGDLLGWMRCRTVRDGIWGTSLEIGRTDWALESPGPSGRLLKELYGAAAGSRDEGAGEHKAYCPARDGDFLRGWFELGFGIEQAYASVGLESLRHAASGAPPVRIEELGPGNRGDIEPLYSLVALAQAGPPAWAGAPAAYLEALEDGFRRLADDRDAFTFLAYDGNRAVGFQSWGAVDEGTAELSVGGTLEAERGKGIGKALTAYGAERALRRGHRTCLADWRTANPSASSFWPSLGFVPYEYRLVRRFAPPGGTA